MQEIKPPQKQKCLCVRVEFIYLNTVIIKIILCKEKYTFKTAQLPLATIRSKEVKVF